MKTIFSILESRVSSSMKSTRSTWTSRWRSLIRSYSVATFLRVYASRTFRRLPRWQTSISYRRTMEEDRTETSVRKLAENDQIKENRQDAVRRRTLTPTNKRNGRRASETAERKTQ
ncbi:MAG: hypothetical protein U5K84_07310 [Alkalibacterium sp.]|nr:hypothetical protein [Alkalibacterium sp.]